MALLFCLLLLVTTLAVLYLSADKAYANIAVGNTSPLPGSSSRGTPWHAVGTGAFDGKYSWVKIYVPVGQSATIVVEQACGLDLPGSAPDVTYYMEDLASGSGEKTETYDGPIGNDQYHASRSGSSGGSCLPTVQLPQISANDGIASEIPGHQGYRAFYLVAKIYQAGGDNERSFQVKSWNNNVLLGTSRPIAPGNASHFSYIYPDIKAKEFSVYQRDAPGLGSQTWDYYVDIAPTCKEAETNETKDIVVYDADEGVYSPQDIKMVVQRSPRQTNPNWSHYETFENLGGNHERVSKSLNWNNQYMYRIHLLNVNWHNTVQIRLPYDQFDATPTGNSGDKCNSWQLSPTSYVRKCGGTWESSIFVQSGDCIEFRHRVSMSGAGEPDFTRKRQHWMGGWINGSNVNGGNGPWVEGPVDTYVIPGGWSPGTKFCELYEVSPRSADNADPKKSAKACAILQPSDTTPTSPISDGQTQVRRDNSDWDLNFVEVEPTMNAYFRSRLTFTNSKETHGDVIRNTNYFGSYDHTTKDFTGTWDWQSLVNTLPIPFNQNPGDNLCQNASGTYTWEEDDEPQSYNKGTNLACAQVVGGRSYAMAEGPAIVEQGQDITLAGGIHTIAFNRPAGSAYGYQLACTYKVTWVPASGSPQELVPITGCDQWIEGNDNLYNSFSWTIPDGAGYGSQLCMQVNIQSLGSTINGPNNALTPQTSGSHCASVVGGKSGIIAGRSTDTAEPTDYVELYGDLNTPTFYNAGHAYSYNVGCSYTAKYMRAGYGGGTSTIQSGPCSTSVGGAGNIRVVTAGFNIPDSTSYIGNQICIYIDIWPAGSTINGPNGNLVTNTSDSECMEIVARPYTKVYGGDTTAGSGFSVGTTPCINDNAAVVGWNRWTGSYYKGAGTQLAIFATGVIKGFGSGQNLTRNTSATGVPGSAYGPANLSFANTGMLPFTDTGGSDGLGATYGGNWGGGSCIADYYSSMPTNPSPDNWDSINRANADAAANNYEPKAYKVDTASAPLTLGDAAGGNVVRGANITIYVDGDVRIVGDVIGSDAAAVAQIPVLTVIAKGNIYIAPNVTKLYGTFIAQPKSGTTGKIYTCASGSTPLVPNKSNYATCGNQLVVTGSFVADKVHLYRNHGSLYQDDGGKVPVSANYTQAAEVFQYNPLNWIRGSLSSVTQSNTTYDAMTSLPPVL